jgi:predicted dehydrogenase
MEQPLRGALVGYGFIAEHGHAPEYRRLAASGGARICAVADVTAARREAAKIAFPGARVYDNHLELLEHEAGRLDFVDVTSPPTPTPKSPRPRLRAASTSSARNRSRRAARSLVDGRARRDRKRVLFRATTTVTPPSSRRSGRYCRRTSSVHLVTLQTFRATHAKGVPGWRSDWRREHRHSGGGIAMDHGSHTFYLAFEWLRSYPTSVTSKISASDDQDTEDNFSCTLTFPTGLVTAQLTWTSGARKILYTLHGTRGAITVDDDVVSVHRVTGAAGVSSELVYTREVASRWMDASHSEWFGRLFEDFRRAIRRGEYVSEQTLDAIKCVETIGAAYASASRGSQEVAIPCESEASALRRLPVNDRLANGTLG